MGKQNHNICPICGDKRITFKREYSDYSAQNISRTKSLIYSVFPFLAYKNTNKYSHTVGHCHNCGHSWNILEDNNSILETLMWLILLTFFVGFILIWKVLQWYFTTDKLIMTINERLYLLCGLLIVATSIFTVVGIITKPV